MTQIPKAGVQPSKDKNGTPSWCDYPKFPGIGLRAVLPKYLTGSMAQAASYRVI